MSDSSSGNARSTTVQVLRGGGLALENSKVGFFPAGLRPLAAVKEYKSQYVTYTIEPSVAPEKIVVRSQKNEKFFDEVYEEFDVISSDGYDYIVIPREDPYHAAARPIAEESIERRRERDRRRQETRIQLRSDKEVVGVISNYSDGEFLVHTLAGDVRLSYSDIKSINFTWRGKKKSKPVQPSSETNSDAN